MLVTEHSSVVKIINGGLVAVPSLATRYVFLATVDAWEVNHEPVSAAKRITSPTKWLNRIQGSWGQTVRESGPVSKRSVCAITRTLGTRQSRAVQLQIVKSEGARIYIIA